MEEWQSGLMHRFTKPATLNWVRGFESYFFRLVDYSSGQRGQTVNLLALPSLVRIQHLPSEADV